jgi:hypothetical protein
MKASELASWFQHSPRNHVWAAWMADLRELIHKRGATPSAIESSVRQFDQTFRAALRQAPLLDVDLFDFDNALEQHLPAEWMRAYLEAARERYRQVQTRRILSDYRAEQRSLEGEQDPQMRLARRFAALLEKEHRLDELKRELT